jgi:hypothetical protein
MEKIVRIDPMPPERAAESPLADPLPDVLPAVINRVAVAKSERSAAR